MNKHFPKVYVVIPHWNGEEILRRCLLALKKTRFPDFEVCIVDNGSTDDSIKMVKSRFPTVKLILSSVNLGFAAGCNLGIRSTEGPYVVLLNNDTEVHPDWLGPLVQIMESDTQIGAVQPKMLSIHDRNRFDYCGAAGGEIDIFGYPFAWGRIFHAMEVDDGAYDQRRAVFWSTGAATLFRRSALYAVGLIEEAFFAHMEEIDVEWRLQWAGYKIMFEPSSVVYHQTGATLHEQELQKMTLNHRNNLLMLLRNHTWITLLWLFPIRLLLETITFMFSLFRGELKRSIAVVLGIAGVFYHWRIIVRGRKAVQKIRLIPEQELLHRMYRGSVALEYFLRGIRSIRHLRSFQRIHS